LQYPHSVHTLSRRKSGEPTPMATKGETSNRRLNHGGLEYLKHITDDDITAAEAQQREISKKSCLGLFDAIVTNHDEPLVSLDLDRNDRPRR
jgi:hypothetical protein